MKKAIGLVTVLALVGLGMVLSTQVSSPNRLIMPPPTNTLRSQPYPYQGVAQAATATQTIPPNTPLATLTPRNTLRPPPTFEPPTLTPLPTNVPTITLTSTLAMNVSIPGLRGAETATPTSEVGCQPRKDWKLEYEVKRDDALVNIAQRYNTTVDELVKANCLTNANVIVIGQHLKVPGQAHPAQPEVECRAFELLTPFDGTMDVPADGQLSFVWVGPRAPINLIRILRPDGSKYERVIELRQNEQISLNEFLPAAGTYTWYVYPLNKYYQQIACPEGGPWKFTKGLSSTPTPTMISIP